MPSCQDDDDCPPLRESTREEEDDHDDDLGNGENEGVDDQPYAKNEEDTSTLLGLGYHIGLSSVGGRKDSSA